MARVTTVVGDVFDAPEGSVLIHACNTQGSWRSGVAASFRQRYPGAHKIYVAHCTEHGAGLAGTALLIPPQPGDEKRCWVGCLFTSVGYGVNVDPPARILANTELALRDLHRQCAEAGCAGAWESVRINSVRFAVEWERTEDVVRRVAADTGRDVRIWVYDGAVNA